MAAPVEVKEEYDVYVHNTQPLAEGEEKHVISVFVADESGLINRVAGVFARRGEERSMGSPDEGLSYGMYNVWTVA